MAYKVAIAGVTATTGGAIAAIANPEGKALIIRNAVLDVTTKSTGAATVDVGVAADAVTSKDTLLDGLDVGTAAGTFDSAENGGTNGKSAVKWGATEYVTVTGSASTAGLVGALYLDYVPV